MVDLSFLHETTSIAAVDADYEARYQPRNRLGLSQCGHECDRWLWYKHNGCLAIPPEGRVLRLFQLGNLVEEQLAVDLQSAGFRLHSRQKYIEFRQDDLIIHGSCDGIIEGLLESDRPHLWECKSMGAKGFARLLKEGYEAYSPQYKAQLHCYMLGLKLTKAFVTVYNKDTSQLYAERVTLDKPYATDILQRVFRIMESNAQPERSCPRPDWYKAKWCDYQEPCWNTRGASPW